MDRKSALSLIFALLWAALSPAQAQQARQTTAARGSASSLPGLPSSAISPSTQLSQTLAPLAIPLAGSSYYEALLQRQKAGEVLDLSRVTRPGIAMVSGERLTLAQGSGRFEALQADELMDLFVPQDQELPQGVTVVERDVPADLVLKANLLSSRGEAGSNPELVGFITQGRTFLRVLAPRETVTAPLSRASHEVEKLGAFLADQARGWGEGSKVDDFLSSPAFSNLSLKARWDTLNRLAQAAPQGQNAVLHLLPPAPQTEIKDLFGGILTALRPKAPAPNPILSQETLLALPATLRQLVEKGALRSILDAVKGTDADEDVSALAAADALLQAVKAALEKTYLSGLRQAPQESAPFQTEEQQGPSCVMHALLNALRLTGSISLQVTPQQFVAYCQSLLKDPSKGRDRGLQAEDLRSLARQLGMRLDQRSAPSGEAQLRRLLDGKTPVLAVLDYYKKDKAALHGYAGVSHAVLIRYAFYSKSEKAWLFAVADSGLGAATYYRWSELKDLLARVYSLTVPDQVAVQ